MLLEILSGSVIVLDWIGVKTLKVWLAWAEARVQRLLTKAENRIKFLGFEIEGNHLVAFMSLSLLVPLIIGLGGYVRYFHVWPPQRHWLSLGSWQSLSRRHPEIMGFVVFILVSATAVIMSLLIYLLLLIRSASVSLTRGVMMLLEHSEEDLKRPIVGIACIFLIIGFVLDFLTS
jgi:hypothetical protein